MSFHKLEQVREQLEKPEVTQDNKVFLLCKSLNYTVCFAAQRPGRSNAAQARPQS